MFNEFQFFEKIYFHELERKQQLEHNATLPTGAIVAAFGLLGYFFTHFHFGGSDYRLSKIVELIFLISSIASFSLLCFATRWCIKTVTGSAYEYLPGATTLHSYLAQLETWYRAKRARNPRKMAERDFQSFLLDKLAKCSQRNWQTNLVRSEELFRTKKFIVYSLVTLAISAITYYIDFWLDSPGLVP